MNHHIYKLMLLTVVFAIGCQIQKSTPSPRGLLYIASADTAGMPLNGAAILLDDVPQPQTTPALIGPLAAGSYVMKLRLRGYTIAIDTVIVSAGDTTRATIQLSRASTGWLSVNSTPGGAKILLNEEPLRNPDGTFIVTPTIISTAVGTQAVSVALSGYRTVSPSLIQAVVSSDTATISFGLEQCTQGKAVGNMPFDFAKRLVTSDSTHFDTLWLDQYRGHLTMFSCWFTTCVPCRNELPYFDQMYREFASRGLRCVALTTLQPSTQAYIQVRQAAQEVGITFPVTLDTSPNFWQAMVPNYANGYPLNILVDTTGAIVSTSGALSEQQLRALITSHLP